MWNNVVSKRIQLTRRPHDSFKLPFKRVLGYNRVWVQGDVMSVSGVLDLRFVWVWENAC